MPSDLRARSDMRLMMQDTGVTQLMMWMRQVATEDAPFKGIFTGFFIIWGAIQAEVGTVLFALCVVCWLADMGCGLARSLHRGGANAFDVGKGLGGLLKMAMVLISFAIVVGFEEAAYERWRIQWDMAWMMLALGAGLFAGSTAGSVGYFVPLMGEMLRNVTDRWKGVVQVKREERQARKDDVDNP